RPDVRRLACNCGASSRRNAVHAPSCPVAVGLARTTVHRGDCQLATSDIDAPPFAWRFTTRRECLSAYDTPAAQKEW
ncbi:hypothetical protein ABK046_53050, partial [Streptomyces caeruleatus]